MDVSVPVVVVPSDLHYSSLGVIRSLGRLGAPVTNINTHPGSPRRPSRYCRDSYVLDVLRLPPEVAVTSLLAIGFILGRRAVLIPINDAMVVWVARHEAELRRAFILPEQPAGLVPSLVDKRSLHELAERWGVPTARTVYPATREELLEMLASIQFPAVLKGIDTQLQERRSGERMVVVSSARELLEHYDRMEDPSSPNLMVQEYIPLGEDWCVSSYVNRHGECVASCTARKLRQHPVTGGISTLAECQDNAALNQLASDFLCALNYRGNASLDFRLDHRDGRFKLLDVNPRPGANSRLYVGRSGLDLVQLGYLDLTGQDPGPAPVAVPDGRKWMVEDLDLAVCLRAMLQGRMSLGEWWRSLRGLKEGAWFAWDDPLPFLRRAWAGAWRFPRWTLRQIARRVGGRVGGRATAVAAGAIAAGTSVTG